MKILIFILLVLNLSAFAKKVDCQSSRQSLKDAGSELVECFVDSKSDIYGGWGFYDGYEVYGIRYTEEKVWIMCYADPTIRSGIGCSTYYGCMYADLKGEGNVRMFCQTKKKAEEIKNRLKKAR